MDFACWRSPRQVYLRLTKLSFSVYVQAVRIAFLSGYWDSLFTQRIGDADVYKTYLSSSTYYAHFLKHMTRTNHATMIVPGWALSRPTLDS
jgi:hypothetical protein